MANDKIEELNIHDDMAESGVVGSVLSQPTIIMQSEMLKPAMFYNNDLGTLYQIMYDVVEIDGIDKIDDFTIVSRIEENDKYKRAFKDYDTKGIRQLISKLGKVGTDNLSEYLKRCETVLTYDFKRKSNIKLKKLAEIMVSKTDKDINELNLYMQDEIMNLSENYLVDSEIKLIKDVIEDAWLEIQERRDGGSGVGFLSKFKTINEFFSYEKSELVIVCGRPKAGKSIFFMNEVLHKLQQGVPCAVFDTEMPTRQWIERFLSWYSGVSVTNIKNGIYTDAQEEKIIEGKEWLKGENFAHIYNPEWTFEEIYTTAKILQRKIGLEFLVFDYIKASNTTSLKIQEHSFLGDMTNFLKNMVGGKLNIAVVAGAQMSPHENRVADSDKINRYASVIAYWKKKPLEEMTDKGGTHKFFIDYNRLGRQFEEDEYIDMYFDGDHCTIKQAKDSVQQMTPFK